MNRSALYSFVLLLITTSTLFGYLVTGIILQNVEFIVIEILMGIFFISILFFVYNLLHLQPRSKEADIIFRKDENLFLTVVLTAYNDELSIHQSVVNFKSHPLVKRVIVISNNSTDNTMEKALEAGAIVHNESSQGYGPCVHRALSEGVNFTDTDLTLLCEGDMTFRAYDIDKFISYLPHADIVSGTRIVDQLRCKNTQLTTFMFYGNFFVGKLLELKHISKGTFTDVGTTYKLCRNKALNELLPKLDKSINLEFNPYFLDKALQNSLKVVECPITFHPRIGYSKGGNVNNRVAMKLGFRMMYGLIIKW